jgi:hypothetical protein
VAVGVVDRLEVVPVADQQQGMPLLPFGDLELLIDQREETPAAGGR